MIYLDNAATTLRKPPQVIDAVVAAMGSFGNSARGTHEEALAASRVIYDTRCKLAALFGCKRPDHVAFTCNSTEALNIAIHGCIHAGEHVISTDLEHNSVLRPLYRLERENNVKLSFVPADRQGNIDYADFERLLRPDTRAVVCTHASNLTGNTLDLACIGAFAHEHDLLFIVDASQSAGVLPIDMEQMHIDVLCFTGHKSLMGPQGTGGIILREGLAETLTPLLAGGTGSMSHTEFMPDFLPDRLEPGTMNLPGLAGLHAALGFLQETGLDIVRAHELALTKHFLDGLAPMQAENRVKIIGLPDTQNRAGVVSIQPVQHDPAELAANLDERFGIATRVGLHCAPAAHQALGTFPTGTIRFSFGFFNTEVDVDRAISALDTLTKEAPHGF